MMEGHALGGLKSSPGSKALLARRIDVGRLQAGRVDGARRFNKLFEREHGRRHISQLAILVSMPQGLQYKWLYYRRNFFGSNIENLESHHENTWKKKPFMKFICNAVVIHVNAPAR